MEELNVLVAELTQLCESSAPIRMNCETIELKVLVQFLEADPLERNMRCGYNLIKSVVVHMYRKSAKVSIIIGSGFQQRIYCRAFAINLRLVEISIAEAASGNELRVNLAAALASHGRFDYLNESLRLIVLLAVCLDVQAAIVERINSLFSC